MKSVEVLLRENIKTLGRCGDVVKVKPGFARNYLFPKRLAIQATPENKLLMARRAVRLQAEEAEVAARIQATVHALTGVVLRTKGRADEGGHLYGSVNAAQVAELLRAAGHGFEEKHVRMDAPIKTVGSHPVLVHVHGDEHATVTVEVSAE